MRMLLQKSCSQRRAPSLTSCILPHYLEITTVSLCILKVFQLDGNMEITPSFSKFKHNIQNILKLLKPNWSMKQRFCGDVMDVVLYFLHYLFAEVLLLVCDSHGLRLSSRNRLVKIHVRVHRSLLHLYRCYVITKFHPWSGINPLNSVVQAASLNQSIKVGTREETICHLESSFCCQKMHISQEQTQNLHTLKLECHQCLRAGKIKY